MPTSERDYYEILGVARDSTPEAIKKAYRGLARKFTPTSIRATRGRRPSSRKSNRLTISCRTRRNGRFTTATAGQRREWRPPALGPTPRNGLPVSVSRAPSRSTSPTCSAPSAILVHDDQGGGASLFEDLIGRVRGGRPSRPRSGRTQEASLTIPFLTAVRGGETTIDIQRGTGKSETLVVKIPAGVDTGAKVRLKGQGEPGGKGMAAGDLTIILERRAALLFQAGGTRPPGRSSDLRIRGHSGSQDRGPHARWHEVAPHPPRQLQRSETTAQRVRESQPRRASPPVTCSLCSRLSCPRPSMTPAGS